MSKITINIYQAKGGDAFLIQFENKTNIVIDMGYKETYKKYMICDFKDIKQRGEKINLLIITHIDEDHLGGAITFFNQNKFSNNTIIVDVEEVWHNSYRHLQLNKEKNTQLKVNEVMILEDIKLNNSVRNNNIRKEDKDISAMQGSTLASVLYEYKYDWNKSFDNKSINSETMDKIDINNINIRVLSPNFKKLKKLASTWLSHLKRSKYDFKITEEIIFDDAYELFFKKKREFYENEFKKICFNNNSTDIKQLEESNSKRTDKSESNGASIAVEINYFGIKMLFLGDSHEDLLIEKFKYMKDNYFDVIKIPHHGSLRNNNEWIDYVKGKYYIFSTDGINHKDHPSDELISKIIHRNKNSNIKIILVFNYIIDLIKKFDVDKMKKLYNYEILYPEKKSDYVGNTTDVTINIRG